MAPSGFVNLYSRDVEAACTFWRDLLGFTETFRTPRDAAPEHVELERDGFLIGLGSVEAARRVHGVEAVAGVASFAVVLWVDDVDAESARLLAAGVPLVAPAHGSGNGNRNALVHDPDGNLVELVSRTG